MKWYCLTVAFYFILCLSSLDISTSPFEVVKIILSYTLDWFLIKNWIKSKIYLIFWKIFNLKYLLIISIFEVPFVLFVLFINIWNFQLSVFLSGVHHNNSKKSLVLNNINIFMSIWRYTISLENRNRGWYIVLA